ncbi:hypothetical protein Hdeb2414_s0019g00547781 [Helianthus debilis subsp. tardiflorus]
MEPQLHTLTITFLLIMFILPIAEPQSVLNIPDITQARVLDNIIQEYAYHVFDNPNNPKTGVVYDGIVPKNLTGIRIAGLRLRTGSLFTRGVPMYKEFRIPIGVVVQPYVERLVLVYQNLGNRSNGYYPLPGYMYLAPVLGLLAYNGTDLSVKSRPELDLQASDKPIQIEFGSVKPAPGSSGSGSGSNPMCVWVDLHGQVNFTNVVNGNRCLTFKQGHFSIVVKDIVKRDKHGGIDSRVWAIVVYVVGGCVLLVMLAVLVMLIRGYKKRKTTRKMERAAEGGEPLHMTMIGGVKAPAAMVTRTQPTLETEYVP